MSIKTTFFLTSIHTCIKVLSGLIMNKIIAVYLSPSGLALIGQFQNISGIFSGVSNASIQTGIVKKTAESSDINHQQQVWSNALIISIGFSILSSVILILFSSFISQSFLGSLSYFPILILLGVSIIFYALNLFVLSILNGLGEIKLYSYVNIIISFATVILVSVLTILYHLKGAMIGLTLTQSAVFLISLFMIYSKYKFTFFKILWPQINWNSCKGLLNYGITTFILGQIISISMIIVRTYIIKEHSLSDAGIWEAAYRCALYFNLFFYMPISIYYLPKLSKAVEKKEIQNHIFKALSFSIPLMITAIIIVNFTKSFIIPIIFSTSFLALNKILIIVLISESFRIIGYVFTTLLMAKEKLFIVIKNEIIYCSTFVIGSLLMIEKENLLGISYSYLVANILFVFSNIWAYSNKTKQN